jgi:Cellulose biosynthesis protein BcsS
MRSLFKHLQKPISCFGTSIVITSGMFCAEAVRADTWATASVFAVHEGVSSSIGTFTPLTHNDLGGGAYSGTYLRTGVTKFKFSGGESAQSYTTKGETLALGLGINRKLDAQTSFLAGVDVEFRKQNATPSQTTNGDHLTLRASTTLYQEWSPTDKLSVTLSYAPRFNSYWAAVMNAHTFRRDGWYIGPQISAAGEMDYRSKSIAAVVGKPALQKSELGFMASIGVSKASSAGSKAAPFLSASISYGF